LSFVFGWGVLSLSVRMVFLAVVVFRGVSINWETICNVSVKAA
jgi:hypothetical protein